MEKKREDLYKDKDQLEDLENEIDKYNDMLEQTNRIDFEEENELKEEIDKYNNLISDKENTRVFNNQSIYEEEQEKQEEKESRIDNNEDMYKEREDFLDEKQSNKKKVIIVILVILIIIAAASLIYYFGIYKSERNKPKKDNEFSETNMKKILNNYGKAIENVIGINLVKKEKLLTFEEADNLIEFNYEVNCKTHEVYEDGKVYLNNCKINSHKTKSSYGKKQEEKEKEEEIVIEDGSFNVYVKDKVATLDEPKDKDGYEIFNVTTGTTPTDITLLSIYNPKFVAYTDPESKVHIKNIKTNKDAVQMSGVTSSIPIYNTSDKGYDTTYVGIEKDDKYGIYNLNTGLLEAKLEYNSIAPLLTYGTTGPTVKVNTLNTTNIAVVKNSKTGVISYKTGEEVIPCNYQVMLKSGNYLYAYNYDGEKRTDETIFDFDGNKYLENTYDEIYGIVDGKYILVKDKSDIKLVQLDGKVLYNYGSIKNLGEVYYFLSYNNEPVFQFESTASDKCIEVSYSTSTKKGKYKDMVCGGIAKPVLYMYPEEKTNVNITFQYPDLLNTTYPKYKDSWDVTVDTNSNITDKNGRNYYALYWDEKLINKANFKTGFYVTKDNAIKFLEEKLFEIGLTDREANEFIMYWLPVLEKNKKSLVYFELTEEREKYNKININPKPDSLLRVAIHIKKVNKKTSIKEQKLTSFDRIGFTVVEWGGTNY